ncbi:MAG: transposase [Thermoplasmata archaeon]|nr:transposase [Thermoplasmata archaeon]
MKQYVGTKWTGNKHYFTPYAQKIKGIFDIFAAQNIHTGERHHRFYSWKNSFIVIDFIDWLLYQIYPENEIYVILDGWSAHRSHAFYAYADLQPRLHLVPLPTCSSWMNPIERDFSHIQRDVLDNSDFSCPMETMEMISAYIKKELNSN